MSEPSASLARGKDTVDLLQHTYKLIRQIIQTLWLDERDEELKASFASLMAYCTIIQDHISRILGNINGTTLSSTHNLITLLSGPLKHIFTTSFHSLSASARLNPLKEVYGKIRIEKESLSKIDILEPYLTLGSTSDERNDTIKLLASCEQELSDAYPEDPSQWKPEDRAPQLNIKEPSYAVWSAAQSIFKAMVSCMDCPCTPAHDFGARLCLGTYRKPNAELKLGLDDELDFDMFLSMEHDWQEVRVHTVKERVVQLIVDQADNCQSKAKCAAVRPMKVKKLCEPIAKSKSMAAYRLELKVTRNQLFKLKSERSSSTVDKSQSAVSLDEFLRGRSGSFTERTKRILAVILSSAVFHLHNTPWLQSTWSSSDVLFFRTSSSAVPLRPFIHTPLSNIVNESSGDADKENTCLDPEDIDPDDIDPDDLLSHQYPTLVTLAMMLLEVYFVAPFDLLAQKYNVKLESGSQSSSFTRYMDVNFVFQACQKEIPQNSQFYLAVENCLDPKVWQDEQGNRLDDLTLRTKIYNEVVLPLETELSQAYSSIPIEDLDRFAQEVDFGSWGQTIQTWNQQANTNASQNHGIVSMYSSPLPNSPGIMQRQSYDGRGFEDRRTRLDSPSGRKRPSLSPSGRETESHSVDPPLLSDIQVNCRSAYTVGILCALPLELLAVRALFDTKHASPEYIQGDSNHYALGMMNQHMVVAACLPSGEYGTNAAADSASNMKRTFPNIKFCLLVGIGGGAPTSDSDIRLGDVVVSLPTTRFPGVIQYDRGKEIEGSTFELTGSLQPPPRCLMTAVSSLRSDPDLPFNPLESYLEDIASRVPVPFRIQYRHPGQDNDCLHECFCHACHSSGVCGNKSSHIRRRSNRPTNHPEIHYGLIASGNRVLKDGSVRDRWAKEYGILCFEMEAAGVMNTFPCLVIRGICDYADSYKDKQWQHYAAATAAAYAKLLLGYTSTNSIHWSRSSTEEDRSFSMYEGVQDPPNKRQRI
ncbi:Pfs domain protein [Fusarium beomiforme]|uniref:Pfs domain protein n=1 Tax=Fusarium beomiforme TaxID=44412 RepID=A0A9P5AFR1_9HYPO|nr:Pfs domain protein [Fusarium beomiforme]